MRVRVRACLCDGFVCEIVRGHSWRERVVQTESHRKGVGSSRLGRESGTPPRALINPSSGNLEGRDFLPRWLTSPVASCGFVLIVRRGAPTPQACEDRSSSELEVVHPPVTVTQSTQSESKSWCTRPQPVDPRQQQRQSSVPCLDTDRCGDTKKDVPTGDRRETGVGTHQQAVPPSTPRHTTNCKLIVGSLMSCLNHDDEDHSVSSVSTYDSEAHEEVDCTDYTPDILLRIEQNSLDVTNLQVCPPRWK